LLSIIGDGECDTDLTSTAAADIFVFLDLDEDVVDDDVDDTAAEDFLLLIAFTLALAALLTSMLLLLRLLLLMMLLVVLLLLLLLLLPLTRCWEENSVWKDLRFACGETTMLTTGGTLLKDDLKAVAEIVVGDRGTFLVVAGEVDERLRPKGIVDEVVECEDVDEDVDKR
jgi:hypothetical protein